ncbi:MAG TPA: fimbria/pilus periplasmic chaperone [Rhizomicrobium sp.]|nr:fimbria/pilus periplasmic chaperone [Rhizomicrobium sp.]
MLFIAATVLISPSTRAAESSLVTSNTRLDFEAGNNVQAITIANPGAAPIRVQARILRWHDSGTADIYSPTTDIGFSPALFSLAPQASQFIRFVVLAPRSERETAYRLVIDQLPDAPTARHVAFPVRLIIPVFVDTYDRKAAPHLTWRAYAEHRRVTLSAYNRGAVHARLSDLTYTYDGKPHVIMAGLAGYVLPGESHSWIFPFHGALLDIAAVTEQGAIHQSVPLTAP